MAGIKGVNPKSIGERSEGQIIASLLRAGKTVLKPFGDNQRYDLVVEDGGHFIKIQCKTGRLRDGAIIFMTCSSYAHRGLGRRDYRGQADMFAVYCPETDTCYMVPVDAVGIRHCSLRIDQTRNGQAKGIRLATEFELRRAPVASMRAEP